MHASATTAAPVDTGADTVAIGIFEGKAIPHDLDGAPLTALLDAGEARPAFRHLAVAHAEGRRWLLVGLGAREDFDAERARTVAATVLERARELGTETLCWELPHKVSDDVPGALVEGTLLAAYRFDRYRSAPAGEDRAPRALIVSAHHDVAAGVARAAVLGAAVNRARDLQNTPANDLTPTALADHARTLEGVAVEVEGRAAIEARGMGAFAAVARGSDEEPALITLRYEPEGARGPLIALVGKAVTFDSGGISIKPTKGMGEMKFDMSGGAAVVEAIGAIAALGLPVRVLGVVGAVENMINGRAMRPGDVVTTMQGTTIEVVSTDAEGRLVLADCLAHAVALGAERIVDIATLTGAIVSALGSTYAGLMSNDDAWAGEVEAAGARTGELVWRLPLHPEYDKLIESRTADVLNQAPKAGAIGAAALLRRFVGDVPWAHVDMAGTGWNLGRPYAAKGGSGYGVRLLVDLVEAVSARAE
jgi:leucyl aminopeptidase